MLFSHGLFFFTVSVQVDSKASKMLDTVNAETNETDRDNGGTSQQDTEVVTSCHANSDKDQVVRTGDEDQSEEVDSANVDGLAEKMYRICYISSDRQKVSFDMNETSNYQQIASALEEEIGDDQKKVSSLEEGIRGDQKKVSSVEDESSSDQEKVREGHTSDDRIAVEKDKDQQTKEPPVSRAHQEGVEHECPSPTNLEMGEVSDYDDDVVVQIRLHEASDSEEEDFKNLYGYEDGDYDSNDDNSNDDGDDVPVVKITVHEASDSDEEEFKKVTEAMM